MFILRFMQFVRCVAYFYKQFIVLFCLLFVRIFVASAAKFVMIVNYLDLNWFDSKVDYVDWFCW